MVNHFHFAPCGFTSYTCCRLDCFMAVASPELADMNSGSSRRRGCSSRTDEEGDTSPNLDFTLYGSPAPRCSYRSTPVKMKKPVQPPNTPRGQSKARKPLQLPIEKILILNEKIENDKREKIKLQLSTKQIKLQDDGGIATSTKKRDHPKQGGNTNFADDSSSATVDLTIDLSSVTNSEHESDSTSEEIDGFFPQVSRDVQERRYSTSTSTDTPLRFTWHLAETNDGQALRSPESSETGYPCTSASSSAHFSESWAMSGKMSPTFSVREKKAPQLNLTPKCCRSKSADLIYVYVNTVNNRNELTKYFRPCHVCNEACCICQDLVSESNRSFSIYSNPSRGSEEVKTNEKVISHSDIPVSADKPLYGNEILTADKTVETDPEMTDIDGSLGTELRYFDNATPLVTIDQWSVRPWFENRCSEFSSLGVNRYESKQTTANFSNNEPDVAFDSGTSTLRRDDANESDSSSGIRKQGEAKSTAIKSIPLSVMQLATAAQCARILANSLESVLEIVDSGGEECPEARDLIRFKGEDLNQLCETLKSLKSHFAASEQEIPIAGLPIAAQFAGNTSRKSDWVGFEGEEISLPISDVGKSTSERDEKLRKCQNLRFEDDFDEFFPKV